MVTDEQYKTLQKRVEELENKLYLLSKQFSTLYMKRDMQTSFSSTSSTTTNIKRDTTKYMFENKLYCKRRLVLACIKKYVEDHPEITGDELEDCFPDYIQGSLGIVRKATEAEKYSGASNRFYFGDDDVLVLHNETYVICSQWDKHNIERFISLMNDLGYEIVIKSRIYY